MWSVYVQAFVFLAIGIYFGDKVSTGDAALFTVSLFATAILRKAVLKKYFSIRVFMILFVAIGIIGYHISMSEKIRALYRYNDNYITASGKIVDLPQTEDKDFIYIVRVKNVKYLDSETTPNELVRVRTDKSFKFGDNIEFRGFLETFPYMLNSGDFDTQRYYKERGIYFKLYTDEAVRSDTRYRVYSIPYFASWIKNLISEEIHKYYQGDEAAILKAIFTGYKDEFSPELEERLYETNTMRLFYPAYLHLTFIMSLIGLLGVYVKKKTRDKILIALVCIYAIYNFNNHYIVKTALVAAVAVFMKMRFGYSNYMDNLCIVCTAVCIVNPLALCNAGFVMSVMSGILIYYYVPIVKERLKVRASKKTKHMLSVWIVLTLGLLPLNAYCFNMTNPYAFLFNFIFVPMLGVQTAVVPISVFAAKLTGLSMFCGISEGLLYFMEWLPSALSELPFYTLYLPRPSVLLIVIFYLGLFLLYRKLRGGRRDNFAQKAAAAVMAGLMITCAVDFAGSLGEVKINFVNVGQGDGAVISLPFRETLLIDGGGSSEYSAYDYGEKIFVPFLRRNGYTSIDAAVVTHYHSDHVKGIIAAMKKLDVKEVIMPDCMEDNRFRLEIERLAKVNGTKLSFYKSGTRLRFNSGLILRIIAPDDEALAGENENDTSYGINLRYGEFSALFMGDLSSVSERKHLGKWGDCDVLKVGHHGSRTSSCEEFLDEVKPEAAVISVGKGNTYSHPHSEVTERLAENNAKFYRTDMCGNITVLARKKGDYKIYGFYG